MDPLSVAASVIAVAGALYTVSRNLWSFAKTLAHAAKEVQAIAKEIRAFINLLRSLRNTMKLLETLLSQARDLLKACKDLVKVAYDNARDFEKFLEDLEPLRDSRGGNLITRAIARLRWASRKNDVLLLRSKLESSKLTLYLCMTTINLRVAADQLAEAAAKAQKDEAQIAELQSQVRQLESQLRSERFFVREAILVSGNLEYHIRGPGKRSVNQKVADKTLRLAKTQEAYERSIRPVPIIPGSSNSSSAPSDGSPPQPFPPRPSSPPLTPPLTGASASSPQQVFPTPDPSRTNPTMAAGMTDSGTWVFDKPDPSRGVRNDPPGQGPPLITPDMDRDVGYRIARVIHPRTEPGSRVKDEGRNVVWSESAYSSE